MGGAELSSGKQRGFRCGTNEPSYSYVAGTEGYLFKVWRRFLSRATTLRIKLNRSLVSRHGSESNNLATVILAIQFITLNELLKFSFFRL